MAQRHLREKADTAHLKTLPRAVSEYKITADELRCMKEGTWETSYEKLGAHHARLSRTNGYYFALWAPGVRSVHVVGDFNGWDIHANPLEVDEASDIWSGFIVHLEPGELYKFLIETATGEVLYKADPYARAAERPPGTASITTTDEDYAWHDGPWHARQRRANRLHEPLNIYEVHLGSWKRHGDEAQGDLLPDGTYPGPGDEFPAQRGTYYTYDEYADELVSYVVSMGYTHIEFMPVMEHPFDGSWGYQVTSYYAPTARFGDVTGLKHLIDACHHAGIGVIFDWVPGGFCADAHGLGMFTGEMLYEREIHPNWGTHKFDYTRGEVRTFLVSNALYWIKNFHIDGIRVDGVSSMLYLNFGLEEGAPKRFNDRGGEEDLSAVAFIRQVNKAVGVSYPAVMMIAEESSAWPLVTYPPEDGGLGFHFKWDMGWMNDTLHYMQTDFPWRGGNHHMLTFSLMYAFNENFILPLSHDEVVHGKCSLITRQPGDQWRKFAGLRTLALYQMTHPGGKLTFMGNEIGQYIEWRYYESIQWFLVEQFEVHAQYQQFIRELNHLYIDRPALWRESFDWSGFEWLSADNAEQSIISFVRRGHETDTELVVLINFTPAYYESFRVAVPRAGEWSEVFNTDDERFGGSGKGNKETLASCPEPCDTSTSSVLMNIPPLAGIVLERVGPSTYKPPVTHYASGTQQHLTSKRNN